ncbi:MAG: alpha/beta hydrolase [Dehalococcoidales bacterium]|nr:alpha/beta hydrolase [Dehalococcoidales bacterium]
MRRDITFNSHGLKCSGWLYAPAKITQNKKMPAIVMAHGFSGTKEQYLDRFAALFAAHGFIVLVFDYRFLGASEGEPRGQVIWYEQIEDYLNAITWVCAQPEVDTERIGVWGTSFSGAHVLSVAAYDRRVKAVVSQVPGIGGGFDGMRAMMGLEGMKRILAYYSADRLRRQQTGKGDYLPVVAPAGTPSALPTADSLAWFTTDSGPTWQNMVTIESMEKNLEYDITLALGRISPTPLLVILAKHDSLIPYTVAKPLFEKAPEPKKILTFDCGHFDIYAREPWFTQASKAELDWFQQHLT